MPKILLIVVNYKNNEETKSFLRGLERQSARQDLHVIVADNDVDGQGREAFDHLKLNYSMETLRWPENLGYFGAAQRAFQTWKDRGNGLSEAIIVCNSDLEIEGDQFFPTLEDILRGGANRGATGVIGPSVQSGLSLRETNPYMISRPPARKMHFIKWVFKFSWTCQLYQWLGLLKAKIMGLFPQSSASEHNKLPMDCYAVHGAFMIFPKVYFERGGDFRHPVFLYNEELQVAEFCRSQGLRARFEPSLKIKHREHGSIGMLYSSQILAYKAEAARYFADKYF